MVFGLLTPHSFVVAEALLAALWLWGHGVLSLLLALLFIFLLTGLVSPHDGPPIELLDFIAELPKLHLDQPDLLCQRDTR